MSMTRSTKRQEQIDLANAYFVKLGLANSVQYFFRTDAIEALLQTTYAQYEERAKELIAQVPEEKQAESALHLEKYVNKDNDFIRCVIEQFKICMANVFMAFEDYGPVDESLAKLFKRCFAEEADGKLYENVGKISREVAGAMYSDLNTAMKRGGLLADACKL